MRGAVTVAAVVALSLTLVAPAPGAAASSSPTPTPSPTFSPTSSPTSGPTSSPTASPSPTPTPTPTPSPTPTGPRAATTIKQVKGRYWNQEMPWLVGQVGTPATERVLISSTGPSAVRTVAVELLLNGAVKVLEKRKAPRGTTVRIGYPLARPGIYRARLHVLPTASEVGAVTAWRTVGVMEAPAQCGARVDGIGCLPAGASPKAVAVISRAAGQLGYQENRSWLYRRGIPRSTFNTWYGGWVKEPWCAIFLSWAFDQTGNRMNLGRAPGVSTKGFHDPARAVAPLRSKGWLTSKPVVGSIALIPSTFSAGGRTPTHVGLVIGSSKDGRTIYTLEGNTNPQGYPYVIHAVMLRIRPAASILAYANPLGGPAADSRSRLNTAAS